MYKNFLLLLAIGILTDTAAAQTPSATWNPNISASKYRNPVINADYSDPDVCRVGNDYWMTSSSFASFPGLQILHSTDLVNWEIVGAALTDYYPDESWKKAVQEEQLQWPNFLSTEVADQFKVKAVPTMYLVTADGTIVAENEAARGESLAKKLAELF